MKTRYFAYLLSATTLASLPLVPAFAQTDTAAQQHSHAFSIPAGRLSQGVLTLSEQAGVQIVFDSDTTASAQGNAVSGTMPLAQALNRLVSGTGLRWRWLKSGVVTIEGVTAGDDEVVTGAVNVEGVQGSPYFGGAGQAAGLNGVNGSRDITATEGTGSFTSGALTIGSKVPQALKDVPQSISVLTSERMAQQNVTDFAAAMKLLPGISLEQGGTSIETSFTSRGFDINSIQIDGGAPLTTKYGFYPQIDMAEYDHVELLRGAAGLFNGYGDPSGTINLVRKKPLDHDQFVFEAQAGSWDEYRVVADATAPLALDGKLRGRLVMTYQDNHYFYDTAKDNKTLVYGIAELDATPTTLITAGLSYTRQDSVPWSGGLPRYQTGSDLHLPRSTCLCFDWNHWDFDTTELFGSVEQKIGDRWTLKLNLTENRQNSVRKVGYSNGTVNPLNGTGPKLGGTYDAFTSKQFSAEATLSGSFDVFGQRQEITIGASRVSSNGGNQTFYDSLVTSSASAPYQPYPGGPLFCSTVSVCPSGLRSPPINVFDFDQSNPLYTEPPNPLPSTIYLKSNQVLSVAYANLRLTAFDRLHLTTGIRWSRYEYSYGFQNLCTEIPTEDPGYSPNCLGKAIGDIYDAGAATYSDDDVSWPPSINLSFDATKSLSIYVGYSDIYRSQANSLTASGKTVAPVTGSNLEAGAKWAGANGRLNLSVAAYRIRQRGFIQVDDSYPYGPVGPGVYCCFIDDPNQTLKSEGVDAEFTGEIVEGLQLAASYTFNRTKYEGSTFGDSVGEPFNTVQPKHLYKLWMSYDFGAARKAGWLSALTLSGGLSGQSTGYRSGTVCTDLNDPNPVTGASTCKSGGTVPYEFTVEPYAVASARVDYRFSANWSLAVNIENIFDKTYYQTIGQFPTSGNWYGTPRSFTATLRAKW